MKKTLFLLCATLSAFSTPEVRQFVNNYPGAQYLPQDFQVYVHQGVASTTPLPGDTSVQLPVVNDYKINPGCYIVCYQENEGVFEVSAAQYAVGLIRVPGKYIDDQCFAHNYRGRADVSDEKLVRLCNRLFPVCDAACWAGFDTAGFFQ
jgi:hypothetical protein